MAYCEKQEYNVRVLQTKYGFIHRKNPQDWFVPITVKLYTTLLSIFIYLTLHQINPSNQLPNSVSRLLSLEDASDLLRALAYNIMICTSFPWIRAQSKLPSYSSVTQLTKILAT